MSFGRRHPRKEPIPPVQLSLDQFAQLCDLIQGFGPQASCDIEFQGTDGSDLNTAAVSDITANDDVVPAVILMPTVRARYSSGNSVELRRETVPAVGQNPAFTTYIFAATGS